jgi:hypothetical protein
MKWLLSLTAGDAAIQGNQEIWKNKCQIILKVAQTVLKPKNTKISAPKLNFNVQDSYISPLLKTKNTYNKPYFETVYFGEIVKKC